MSERLHFLCKDLFVLLIMRMVKNLLQPAELLGPVVEGISGATAATLTIRIADITALVVDTGYRLVGQEIASSVSPRSDVARGK